MSDDINPFDHADDLNPFQVNDYNPFQNTSTPMAAPGSHQIPMDNSMLSPELKFRDTPKQPSFVQPDANFYGNPQSHQSQSLFGPPSGSVGIQLDEDPFQQDSGDHSNLMPPSSFTTANGRVSIKEKKAEEKSYSFWQIEFYQQFYNVDSSDVATRCLRAMWPFKFDFIDAVKDNPDFYGPFWVSTTLIFMMAACGNFAAYLGVDAGAWQYDVAKLMYGAVVIYGYILLFPTGLWLYWRWQDIDITLISVLCIYGYSLFVFLPVSVLSVAPVNWLKWVFVGIGYCLSAGFLVVNLWAPLRGRMVNGVICLIIIAVLHAGLALTFRLYFFCYVPLGSHNFTCT